MVTLTNFMPSMRQNFGKKWNKIMEGIEVVITTLNKVNLPFEENGKIMSFCADGSAVVLITSGPNKNYFKRVQINQLKAFDKVDAPS